MNSLQQSCLLITGIMASGKSTIAQHLAESLPKSVHLRGDKFRTMIVNGRVEPTADMPDEALNQLRLRYSISASVAEQYCQTGFTVIYQDVIIGRLLSEAIAFHNEPLYVVVLCPSPDIATQRDTNRHKQAYSVDGWTAEMMHTTLLEETPKVGLWLDTSNLSIEQTTQAILAQLDKAKIT